MHCHKDTLSLKHTKAIQSVPVPCVSWCRCSVVTSPSSAAGSAAGSRAKDCHAVRSEPKTLFLMSMLIRVRLSLSSTARQEAERYTNHPEKMPRTNERRIFGHTQVHPLASFMVRDEHGLQIHLWHNHRLYPISHWVVLHGRKRPIKVTVYRFSQRFYLFCITSKYKCFAILDWRPTI